jgi:hypothetical protein
MLLPSVVVNVTVDKPAKSLAEKRFKWSREHVLQAVDDIQDHEKTCVLRFCHVRCYVAVVCGGFNVS